MALHVIVGAGPVGTTTARILADRGDQVRLVSRSGSGPRHALIQPVTADATDAAALGGLVDGATALYNCANPRYHRWATDWPPLADSLLATAGTSGAVLVTMSNLYGYGRVDVPMTEQLPLRPHTVKGRVRARMWQDALAAHQAGRVRVAEARASDFVGAGAQSIFAELALPKLLAGKRVSVPADLDAPHSWTYLGDAARMLVTLADDPRAWGAAWHVPSPPPASFREITSRAAELAGVPAVRLARIPDPLLRLAGLADPQIRAFWEMRYQFQQPFIIDATAARTEFGIAPTPLDTGLRELIEGNPVEIS